MRARIFLAGLLGCACLGASGGCSDDPGESAADARERERLEKRYWEGVRRDKRRVLRVVRAAEAAGRARDWTRVCSYYSPEARREARTLFGTRTCADAFSLAIRVVEQRFGVQVANELLTTRRRARIRVRGDFATVTYSRFPRSVPRVFRAAQFPTTLRKRRGRWRFTELE